MGPYGHEDNTLKIVDILKEFSPEEKRSCEEFLKRSQVLR
jgi:hypothetical protein